MVEIAFAKLYFPFPASKQKTVTFATVWLLLLVVAVGASVWCVSFPALTPLFVFCFFFCVSRNDPSLAKFHPPPAKTAYQPTREGAAYPAGRQTQSLFPCLKC